LIFSFLLGELVKAGLPAVQLLAFHGCSQRWRFCLRSCCCMWLGG
jgi:hypothetical protein